MVLAKRIIPCLDVTDGRVVKGVNFVNLRDAGDPVEIARAYDEQEADELVFLDITASSSGRETMVDVVFRTAECVFMPLTVGGGIRNLDDMRKMLLAGADKVSINTSAVQNPELIRQGAERFGSQCIVVAIDAKRRRLTDRHKTARQARQGMPLQKIIVQMGLMGEDDILAVLGESLGMKTVRLSDYQINPKVLEIFPGDMLAWTQSIPVAIEGKTVMVAFADPFNTQAIDAIRLLLEREGYELQPAIAREDDVEAALGKYYPQAKAEHDRLLAEQMHKAEEALEQAVEEELSVEEKIERIFEAEGLSVCRAFRDALHAAELLRGQVAPGSWEVYIHGGRTPTGLDAVEWARRAESLGAGEILLTSMDRDGTKDGYDIELTRTISEAVLIPVIASGGAGTLEHLYEALEEGKADAVLAASIFHFRQHTIHEARDFLRQRGVPVRD